MRPRVLTFVPHYLPGYRSGGPVRTIANLVEHLGDEIEFRVVTTDRDAMDSESYPDIEVGTWCTVGKAEVFYCRPHERSMRRFGRLMSGTPHDVLYLNSFFDPRFTLRPLLARRLGIAPGTPCILAPRGEFSEGALGLKKWKKRAFVLLVRMIDLYEGVTWQASSEHEAADIRRVLGEVGSIEVARNLPPAVRLPPDLMDIQHRHRAQPLRVLFLSRITPKKNLDFALRVVARVTVPVEFNIYGPVRDESYWVRCRELLEKMPSQVTVTYRGSVFPAQVPRIMATHDVLFLPTLGENYGHVIPEALAAGTPVLIADTTPWRGLEEAGVGWDLPLDSHERFARRLEYCASLDSEKYAEWRKVTRDYAVRSLHDPAVVEANRRLFLNAVG